MMEHNMDLTIEELSMNAWPSIKAIVYDGWIIRFADGYANRANSIIPLYPSKIKLKDKIEYCEDLFARHNLPAAYKLTNLEGPAAAEHRILEAKLQELNYQKINETQVQICDISAATAKVNTASDTGKIVVLDYFSEEWIQSVIEFNQIEDKYVPAFKKIIGNIGVNKIVLHREAEGKIVSCGYGTIERGYVGIFDIVVKQEERRKGYGREIVEAILSEGAKRGATKSFLQVMLSNQAALSLYKKMGYREAYRYWYRKKIKV